MKKLFLIITALVCSISGCGYTTRSALPANLRTIHVELFENKIDFSSAKERQIYIPLIEVKIHKAIVDRFLFDGNLRIAKDEHADLILRGKLIDYRKDELRTTDNNDVQEFRANVIVSMELWNVANQELMWAEERFVGDATFFIEGALATTEESAAEAAIEDLARRIVERAIEDW